MMVCSVPNAIVVVISPLLNLMEYQTKFLLAQRISTGSTEEDKAVKARIENGECCVVFTSPVTYLCWEMVVHGRVGCLKTFTRI